MANSAKEQKGQDRSWCHIKSIKIGRLRFAGHFCGVDPSINYRPFGTRTRGRPKLRWADCVEDNFKVLRVTNWRTVAKRRLEWKRILEKALAHPRLLYQ
ncbi:hypothetical protein TNCV_1967631 [Trichonephila clavipes]|nr:hypothetical protein TNCV_1967631 [Trichonephila clavipes]